MPVEAGLSSGAVQRGDDPQGAGVLQTQGISQNDGPIAGLHLGSAADGFDAATVPWSVVLRTAEAAAVHSDSLNIEVEDRGQPSVFTGQ